MTKNSILHGCKDATSDPGYITLSPEEALANQELLTQERNLSYRFYPHFHPYVGFAEKVKKKNPKKSARF
jgi:hypothetical protein